MLVVIAHTALLLATIDATPHWLTYINDRLAAVRMPLFFFLSGVVSYRLLKAPFSELLRRRFAPLSWLFLLWGAIRWIFFQVVPNPIDPSEGLWLGQIFEQIIWPSSGLWFIWALLIYTAATSLISRISIWLCLAVSALISLLAYASALPIEFYAHEATARNFMFFTAGAALSTLIVSTIWKPPVWQILTTGLAAIAAMLALAKGVPLPIPNWTVFLRVSAGVFGVASVVLFGMRCGTLPQIGRPLGYLGRNTAPIYLGHVLIVAVSVHFLTDARLPPAVVPSLFTIVVAAAVVLPLTMKLAADRIPGLSWLFAPPMKRLPERS